MIKNLEKNGLSLRDKVLVTGGAGYAGSVLVPKLLDRGYNVRVLDSMIFGPYGLNSVKDRCEIVCGDIRDSELVKRSLGGVSSVIHLAAIANDAGSELNPQLTEQINFEATKKLVRLSKEEGIKRFIYASSCSVYGFSEEPIVTEESFLNPLSIYAKSKAWSEQVINKSAEGEFVGVNLRPATVCGYSPRMRLDLVINTLTNDTVRKRKMVIFGRKQTRSNIHIEDMADCYICLLEAPSEKINQRTFNAGYENHTIEEIAKIIKEIIGQDVVIDKKEGVDNRSYRISSEKIKQELGFTPKKTIRDAVIEVEKAIEKGLIPNPSDSIYRNVKRMKEIGMIKE